MSRILLFFLLIGSLFSIIACRGSHNITSTTTATASYTATGTAMTTVATTNATTTVPPEWTYVGVIPRPGQTAVSTLPLFAWYVPKGTDGLPVATCFDLIVSTSSMTGLNGQLIVPDVLILTGTAAISGQKYQTMTPLKSDTIYFWQVMPVPNGSAAGQLSMVRSFHTAPAGMQPVGETILTIDDIPNPWPDMPHYSDQSGTDRVKPDQEFVIQYQQFGNMFPIIREEHDADLIQLIDSKGYANPDYYDGQASIGWYLFKAVKPGNTTTTIKHFGHLNGPLEEQKVFSIVIE